MNSERFMYGSTTVLNTFKSKSLSVVNAVFYKTDTICAQTARK